MEALRDWCRCCKNINIWGTRSLLYTLHITLHGQIDLTRRWATKPTHPYWGWSTYGRNLITCIRFSGSSVNTIKDGKKLKENKNWQIGMQKSSFHFSTSAERCGKRNPKLVTHSFFQIPPAKTNIIKPKMHDVSMGWRKVRTCSATFPLTYEWSCVVVVNEVYFQ